MDLLNLNDVITEEKKHLYKRRETLGEKQTTDTLEDIIGIASSGGGIRSATVNLGFIEVLNHYGLLQMADYHSTVSGGGYTGSFIQATLRKEGVYHGLFSVEKTEALRFSSSDYMQTGSIMGILTLLFGYLTGLLFSLLNPMIILAALFNLSIIISAIFEITTPFFAFPWNYWIQTGFLALLVVHALSSIVFSGNLDIPKRFIKLEIWTVILFLCVNFVYFVGSFKFVSWSSPIIPGYLINLLLLILIGFFTKPDTFSFGKFYQKQLADAFLQFAGKFRNAPLKDFHNADSQDKETVLAPYPLINACVNFSLEGSDYFLLSPFFCGSKLTGYLRTESSLKYKSMSLPKAVGISAAAVNAGMGTYSNSFFNFWIALFNAGLGYLMPNPYYDRRRKGFIWGPLYYFKILLSKMGPENALVNLSDGGHIENLGVLELLRRQCRLIICMDADADAGYTFDDLRNLIRRSRNELGIEIRFREDSNPFEMIKPDQTGYSNKRFVVADLMMWWERKMVLDEQTGQMEPNLINYAEPIKVGTFVYVKSSLRAPQGMPYLDRRDALKYDTFRYKLYNQNFPHDATSDQSFSVVQWESYRQLGRFLAAEALGIEDLGVALPADKPSRKNVLDFFDLGTPLLPLEAPNISESPEAYLQ